MNRIARNHMNPAFPAGDYVPTLRLQPRAQCLTAVNWGVRNWVKENRVFTVDFYDRRVGVYVRVRCQAVDWQQLRHASSADRVPGKLTRLEIDYGTALAVHAVPANTRARLAPMEVQK